jgi:hypothetical protein
VVGELSHPELEQRDEMSGGSKWVSEWRARFEREGRDDGAVDLRDDVRSSWRWASLEVGEAVERVLVTDAGDPQQHRLGRRVGGRSVLA